MLGVDFVTETLTFRAYDTAEDTDVCIQTFEYLGLEGVMSD